MGSDGSDLPETRWDKDTMPKLKINGIDLHYITVGKGSDVVMVHGFLGNLAVWHLQIVPQLRNFYSITTMDLRGHGYSQVTPSGYTAAEMANDLKGLLDALGIQRVSLVGHSYGADVCLYFALLYPERVQKLVALEPGLAALVEERKDANWEGWSYWVTKLEEVGLKVPDDKKSDLSYLLQLSLETPKVFGPARGLPRNREPLINLIRNTTLIKDYEFVGELTLDAVRRIQTSVLLVYGDKSHFLGSYDFLRATLPNCQPVLLPGGEHFGPLEQPDELCGLIRGFLGTSAGQVRPAPRISLGIALEAGSGH
jgi:pimeloyl-ACP methyl ester carboxylesterase